MLARHYGWTPHFEPVIDNPYLEDYYADIRRWAFNLEVYFLKERFRSALAIAREDGTSIQDRTIFEGVYVFTANNYAQGQLSKTDFETYMDLFRQMTTIVRHPDLTIYLKAPIEYLVSNIQKRGRSYEQTMPLDYLQGLNTRYDEFIGTQYKGRVITIDVAGLDFKERKEDLLKITDLIDAELFGLFSNQNNKL